LLTIATASQGADHSSRNDLIDFVRFHSFDALIEQFFGVLSELTLVARFVYELMRPGRVEIGVVAMEQPRTFVIRSTHVLPFGVQRAGVLGCSVTVLEANSGALLQFRSQILRVNILAILSRFLRQFCLATKSKHIDSQWQGKTARKQRTRTSLAVFF
jgi:hypothetical protein